MKKVISALLACMMIVTSVFVCGVSTAAKSIYTSKSDPVIWSTDGKYTKNGVKNKDKYYTLLMAGIAKSDFNFIVQHKVDGSAELGYVLITVKPDGCDYYIEIEYDKAEKTFSACVKDEDGEKLTYLGRITSDMPDDPDRKECVMFSVVLPKNKYTTSLVKQMKKADKAVLTMKNYYNTGKHIYDFGYELRLDNIVCNWEKGGKTEVKEAETNVKFKKIKDVVYTGKALTPKVVITDGDYTLKQGKDYNVKYNNNKEIGKGSVVVIGLGKKYTDINKTLTFNIVPPATTVKAAVSGSSLNISWSKVKKVTGYQVYYSADNGKTFKKLKDLTSLDTSCKVALDKTKKYQFKVRSYKKIKGVYYYSPFSDVVYYNG